MNNKIAHLRLGLSCNQNCLYCTVKYDDDVEMTTKDVFVELKKLSEKANMIDLTGGEPTLRKDLHLIINYAKKCGFNKIRIQTNGVLLSNLNLLKKLNLNGLDSVMIGLSTHERDTYLKITQTDYFNKVISAINNCLKLNVSITLYFVICKINYKKILDFVKYFRIISKKIKFAFAFVRPNGNVINNNWIVPKLTEIDTYVYDLMNYLSNKKINFLIEGIPLCYMCGYENNCAEVYRQKINKTIYSNKYQEYNLHNNIHKNLKVKSSICKNCIKNNVCVGVWKEYASLYGLDELKIIK